MVLNQSFKFFLLLLLLGCSENKAYSEINYSEEFGSIVTEFNESSIFEFNSYGSFNDDFVFDFLEKLDPNKTIFFEEDIDKILSLKKDSDYYPIFKLIVDIFYKRINESTEYRIELLNTYNFDFEKDEYIFLDSHDVYFSDQDTKNNYQRKYVKNELILKMLEEKSFDDSKDELLDYYSERISSLSKIRESDKFTLIANTYLSLLDPHASYFSQRDLENWNLRMNLSFEGIGAILSYENEKAKIEELMPGGPAIKSKKINVGDKIIGIGEGLDGKIISVIGWRLDDIVERIRGNEGTIVRIEIENESGKSLVEIERGKVSLEESDASKEIISFEGKKLGYISLPSFYSDIECMRKNNYLCKSATSDIKKILVDFKSNGIEGIVIDLRDNGGGYLHEADTLTRLFIKYGPTVQIKSPDEEVIIFNSWRSNRSWDKPVVVLVNKFSASASEIFAGALQDYNRALIIGQTTFGKGSVQTFTETNNGQIKVTDSLYYRITGEPTQIYGVKPNLEIPSLTNSDGTGEDRYENAIKPSYIESARYYKYGQFNIEEFVENHNERVYKSQYFTEMKAIKESRKEKREKLSLNLSSRKLDYFNSIEKNLSLINLSREISGQEKFTSYQEYLDTEISDDFIIDAEIDLSLRILVDLIGVES